MTSHESMLEQARTLMRQNRLAEAQTLCAHLVSRESGNPAGWNLLGKIHLRLGQGAEAEDCFRRTVELQPGSGRAHMDLAFALLSPGRYREALSEFEKSLRLAPDTAAAYCGMGLVQSRLGDSERAVTSLETALRLQPGLAEAYYNLGVVFMDLRRYDRAVVSFKEAIGRNSAESHCRAVKTQALLLMRRDRLKEAQSLLAFLSRHLPRDIELWHALSAVHRRLGRYDEAVECCRHVLSLDPNHEGAQIILGHTYLNQGDTRKALTHFRTALEINPTNTAALANFGRICLTWTDMEQYLALYRRALTMVHNPAELRRSFVAIVAPIRPERYDPWLDEELQRCFELDDIPYQFLAQLSAHVLKLKYPSVLNSDRESSEFVGLALKLAADRLLIHLLEKGINADADLERFFTRLRRELLAKYRRTDTLDAEDLPVVAALARQCHHNEYVFSQDEQEEQWIDAVRLAIESEGPKLSMPTPEMEQRLVVFGMYDSLTTLTCHEHLGTIPLTAWTAWFRGIVEETLLNPLAEQRLKADIPSIGRFQDETTRMVRSQYEENPYPRWSSLIAPANQNLKQALSGEFPHFSAPEFLDGPTRILVAGCGTGRHPIQKALSYPNAEIVAVDISKSSLAYAIRMARHYGVRNVRFIHGDILELGSLEQRFHIIESAGVLHHMRDPMAGWRVLVDLLVDNGLMLIALYSEKGRQSVVVAREAIKQMGLTSSRRDIRSFRHDVLNRERDDIFDVLIGSVDFYTTSACRDLLFHFMEHRFTVPQLDAAFEALGLTFIGFTLNDPRIKGSYLAKFPDDVTMTNLAYWDRYEINHPDTFRTMYQFWCQKKEPRKEN